MPSIDIKKIENILIQVSKPGRYLGNEWNAVKKDFDSVILKIALCFPDIYEIGMSHFGFKILYHLLNEQPDISCERIFALWPDMQDILAREKLPIFSLESKRPMPDFDLIGFSLQHELSFTNALRMLSSAGIPLSASERGEKFPLVIAGGVCSFNPEPMAEFFDAFFIGEAEEAILEIITVLKNRWVKQKSKKIEILKELAKIEGIYIPSFYEVGYEQDGSIKNFSPKNNFAPKTINKRIVKDFESAYYPVKQIVPYIQIVHDRISLEIMRGCPNRCYFCQASSIYWPKRQRSTEKILQLAQETYKATGYEEISLLSLSTSDHTLITEILKSLVGYFKSRKIAVSLPSLRAQDMLCPLTGLISSIKKTGLTFAPEAGSQRLRDAINKRLDPEKLYNCIAEAAKNGWRHVKLYFMLGLPAEKEKDIHAIAELIAKISKADKLAGKPFISVTASVSFFIPRPHTPFESETMLPIFQIKERQAVLRKNLKAKGVVLKWHNAEMSFLEAVLARGDRRLSKVILNAYESGAGFDNWSEHFNFKLWRRAFDKTGINPDTYLYRRRKKDEILPWSHIQC